MELLMNLAKGFGYNLNTPLPNGTGDDGYVYAMNELVFPSVQKFEPELIVLVAGQDSSAFDPNGRILKDCTWLIVTCYAERRYHFTLEQTSSVPDPFNWREFRLCLPVHHDPVENVIMSSENNLLVEEASLDSDGVGKVDGLNSLF